MKNQSAISTILLSEVPRALALTADYDPSTMERRHMLNYAEKLKYSWMVEVPDRAPGVHGLKDCRTLRLLGKFTKSCVAEPFE